MREAWGDGRQSVSPEEREREREEREREEEEGDASEEEVQSLTERLEEKETRLDYNRERTQVPNRRHHACECSLKEQHCSSRTVVRRAE